MNKLNKNSPFNLLGLEIKGHDIRIMYSIDTDMGATDHEINLSFLYNNVPDEDVAEFNDALIPLNFIPVFLDNRINNDRMTLVIDTMCNSTVMYEVRKAIAIMEEAGSQDDDALELIYGEDDIIRNAYLYRVNKVVLSPGQDQVQFAYTKGIQRTQYKIQLPVLNIDMNAGTAHPTSKMLTWVAADAVRDWLLKLENIAYRWVSQAVFTTNRQLELFDAGEWQPTDPDVIEADFAGLADDMHA